MVTGLRWLALEVTYLEDASEFYHSSLDLPVLRTDDRAVTLAAGETALVLRRPADVPRGGLHTHFAFSIPPSEYDDWWTRLSGRFDLEEHRFGSMRSLYLEDPDGHCVELGGRADEDDGPGIAGIFEVVLEVEDLAAAEAFYTDLGFELVDRGEERRRVRLTAGPFDVELWEPQLGLADARGGVHVDVGLETPDPVALVDRVADRALAVEPVENVDAGDSKDGADGGDDGNAEREEQGGGGGGAIRVKDPDGHYLTFS